MKSLPLLFAVLFVSTTAVADEWQETKSQEGNFRVLMPGETNYLPQDVDGADGRKIKLHVFAVETEDGALAWLTFYNDYTEEHVRDTGATTILRNSQKGALESANATLTKESEIVLGEHPGREFRFTGESDGQPYRGVWRLYLVNNRLYQLGLIAVDKPLPEESVAKYFGSFELLRK